MKCRCNSLSLILLSLLGLSLGANVLQAAASKDKKVLRIYSDRSPKLFQPVIDMYLKDNKGIEISLESRGSAESTAKRIAAEKDKTQADLFVTVDVGNLWEAAEMGILEPVTSKKIAANVPQNLRDSQNRWTGLSLRARTIVYNTTVKGLPAQLKDYGSLADPKWKGRLCLRTSKKVYNRSLVADLIARMGEKKVKEILKGWVNNLATAVKNNDSAVILAVAKGQCDLGIVNSYYYGRELAKDPKIKASLFFVRNQNGGTHLNLSGGGIVKHSDNKKAAQAFLEWLTSEKAQALFASLNYEYPVNKAAELDPITKKFTSISHKELLATEIPVEKYGAPKMQRASQNLMDQVGYK